MSAAYGAVPPGHPGATPSDGELAAALGTTGVRGPVVRPASSSGRGTHAPSSDGASWVGRSAWSSVGLRAPVGAISMDGTTDPRTGSSSPGRCRVPRGDGCHADTPRRLHARRMIYHPIGGRVPGSRASLPAGGAAIDDLVPLDLRVRRIVGGGPSPRRPGRRTGCPSGRRADPLRGWPSDRSRATRWAEPGPVRGRARYPLGVYADGGCDGPCGALTYAARGGSRDARDPAGAHRPAVVRHGRRRQGYQAALARGSSDLRAGCAGGWRGRSTTAIDGCQAGLAGCPR